MLSATKAYLCSAFITWTEISNTSNTPSWVTSNLRKNATVLEQWEFLRIFLGKFVDEFVLTEFDIEKKWREAQEEQRHEKENEGSRRSQATPAQENAQTIHYPGLKH